MVCVPDTPHKAGDSFQQLRPGIMEVVFLVVSLLTRCSLGFSRDIYTIPPHLSCDRKMSGDFCDDPGVWWQLDGSVSRCPACSRDFGVIRRRHHCRACGTVFCDDCCPKGRQPSTAPSRTCLSCREVPRWLRATHYGDAPEHYARQRPGPLACVSIAAVMRVKMKPRCERTQAVVASGRPAAVRAASASSSSVVPLPPFHLITEYIPHRAADDLVCAFMLFFALGPPRPFLGDIWFLSKPLAATLHVWSPKTGDLLAAPLSTSDAAQDDLVLRSAMADILSYRVPYVRKITDVFSTFHEGATVASGSYGRVSKVKVSRSQLVKKEMEASSRNLLQNTSSVATASITSPPQSFGNGGVSGPLSPTLHSRRPSSWWLFEDRQPSFSRPPVEIPEDDHMFLALKQVPKLIFERAWPAAAASSHRTPPPAGRVAAVGPGHSRRPDDANVTGPAANDPTPPPEGSAAASRIASVDAVAKGVSVARVLDEVTMHRAVHHPHVSRLIDVFQTSDSIVLVMEFGDGGTVNAAVRTILSQVGRQEASSSARRHGDDGDGRAGHGTEDCDEESRISLGVFAAHVANSVAKVLCDLYQRFGLVHRDLKADNVVFSRSLARVMLIDFGMACLVRPDDDYFVEDAATQGTPGYLSPEVLRSVTSNSHTVHATGLALHQGDLFALGIILYCLLGRCKPAAAYRRQQDANRLISGKDLSRVEGRSLKSFSTLPTYSSTLLLFAGGSGGILCFGPEWEPYPPHVRHLIEGLLRSGYHERLTATAVQSHPFVAENAPLFEVFAGNLKLDQSNSDCRMDREFDLVSLREYDGRDSETIALSPSAVML